MINIPVVLIDREDKNISSMLSFMESIPNIKKTQYSKDIYDLEHLFNKKSPAVVIVGPSYDFNVIIELLEHYKSVLNIIRIIVFTKTLSADLLKSALKLNIHDVLEYPVKKIDLKESIERAYSIFRVHDIPESEKLHNCKKIMFFSAKGGSGNTFLAINFAVGLKARAKCEVSLYDLNYQFGDVALMLNIYPKNTIFDLMSINKFDEENLDVFLIKHNSGIKILPAPIDPSQGEAIGLDVSNKVLEGLGNMNDFIVIDAPFDFSDEVVAFLEKTDYLFVVATKDVPSVKNLKICLQLLERINFPRERTFVILNRSDSKVEYEIDEIEKTIQRKVDFKIPSDRLAPVSVNKGIPIILSAPRSVIAKHIYKIVDYFFPKSVKAKKIKNSVLESL